eukprot:3258837-Rhodomonas_salina.2
MLAPNTASRLRLQQGGGAAVLKRAWWQRENAVVGGADRGAVRRGEVRRGASRRPHRRAQPLRVLRPPGPGLLGVGQHGRP